MVELLVAEKRRLLAENGRITHCDFRQAWEACWEVMVLERAFAHNTPKRRLSRAAMVATRSEVRHAFLESPSAFEFAARRLATAADGMCLELAAAQVPDALLAAIVYVETTERQELMAAA